MPTTHHKRRYGLNLTLAPCLGAVLSSWSPWGLTQEDATAQTTANADVLSTVTVTGEAITDVDGPTKGYEVKGSRAATKIPTPLIKTARTVNVITRQQIEDQAVTNLNDALLYTPGAFTGLAGASKRSDTVSLRGFHGGDVDNTFVDGLRLQSDPGAYSAMQVDPFFLERIDVLKGPSSTMYGHSMPGGMVDMTTKKPEATPHSLLHFYAGNHDTFGLGFDTTGALPNAELGEFRLTTISSQSNTQFDVAKRERWAIMPQLNLHLNDSTDLLLQALIQHDPHGDFHGSVPYALGGKAIYGDRVGTYWVDADPHNDVFKREQHMFSYQLTHYFNDNLTFTSRARYTDMILKMGQVAQWGFTDPAPGEQVQLRRSYYGAHERLKAFSSDNNLLYHFRLGNTQHDLLMGVDWSRMRNAVQNFSGEAANMDPFVHAHLQQGLIGDKTRLAKERHRIEQGGLYLQDQMKWGHWVFGLGGREDWMDRDYRQRGTPTQSRSDHRFSGSTSVLYAFDNGISPYYAYSEAFDPTPQSFDAAGVPTPVDSVQHEVGIKYQPPGTKDLYQVALYNLRQKNVQQRVSVDPPLYAGVGSVRARGLELSANTALTRRLNMIAGYTYNKIEYRSNIDLGSVHLEKGLSPALSPRQMASLWLHYDFGRGIRGGLGERYVEHSDFYTDSAQVSKASRGHTASYALTDAFLSTELSQWSSALKGINVKLNATNLFDKKYLTGCFSEQYCYFGDRRQVTATVDYSF